MYPMPDINKLYNTPAERILAAQSALSGSIYGMGNLIKAELVGDFVEFVSTATGKRSQSLMNIVSEVGSFDLTNFSSINVGTLRKSGRPLAGNKLGSVAGLLESITDQIKDPNVVKALEDAGISSELIKDFKTKGQIDILTMHGTGKNIGRRIREMRERGNLHGISVLDDEGGRVLQFRAGKNVLTSAQSELLLSITGHGLLDRETFENVLKAGDPVKLSKELMKVPKRGRSLLAERELSISGGELAKFLGRNATSVEDAFVVLDPHADIMKMYAGIKNLGSKDRNAYYYGTKKYAREFDHKAFTDQLDKLSDADQTALKAIINNNKGADGKQLLNAIKKHFKKDSDEMKIIQGVFDSIEYDFDGSDVLNSKNVKSYIKSLQSYIKKLDPSKDRQQIAEIESQIKSLQSGLDYGDQITGRGRIAGLGRDIKTAFQITDLQDSPFAGKAGIISMFGTKGELGLMGKVDSLLLSGFGEARDFVYADPVSAAFNPEIFADKQTRAAIRKNMDEVLEDFRDAANSSVLPEKIKAMLQKSIDMDISTVDPTRRSSALRNRMFAQQLMDLHMSGIGPKQSPQMMNLLHSFFAAQAFREKDGFVQPVLPDTKRFAVDSETILHKTGSQSILGRNKYSAVQMMLEDGKTVSNELVNFRIKGHKMLFAQGTIGNIRHALGGFDLDDKGLPKLTTYMDENNKRRMAFHVYRQPSGPEEILLTKANMDFETIQGLFGGDTFRAKLDEKLAGISPNKKIARRNYEALQFILDSQLEDLDIEKSGTFQSKFTGVKAENIEQTIIELMQEIRGKDGIHQLSDRAARRFGQYGSSSLTIEDVTGEPAYTRKAIFKIKEAAGSFDMTNEIQSVLNSGGYSKKTVNKVNKIINGSANFEELMQRLGNSYDNEVAAVFSQAFQEKQRAGMEAGQEILGLYVNRSMAVGSFLDQYEDFLNTAGVSKKAQKFMLRNYKIGLLAQETAIDAAINFAGSKQLSKETLELIATRGGALDQAAIGKAIGELGGFGANFTLEQIGEKAISNLGKIVGFSAATDAGQAFGIGLDELLITNRLKGDDIKVLVGGIIQGMEDSFNIKAASKSDDVKNLLDELRAVQTSEDYDRMQQVLLRRFALSSSSQYASLSALDQSGFQKVMEGVRKGLISNIAMDPTLSSANPSAEAKSVAKAIIDRHKDELEKFYGQLRESTKDLSNQEALVHRIKADNLGTKILSDIEDATKVKGVTMQDLVDAIDYESQSRKLGIDKLSFFTGDTPTRYEKTAQMMDAARKYRRARYYENMLPRDAAGNVVNDTLTRLEAYLAPNQRFTMENMSSQVRQILTDMEQGNYGVYSTYDQDVFRSLVGDTVDYFGPDETYVNEVGREAEIIRQQMIMEDLRAQNAIDDLSVAGTIADPAQAPDEGFTRAAVNASLQDLDDESDAAKATYKRFGDAIRDGDIGKLFENKMIKRGTIALGALAIGSFIYSGLRDRSQDDMQGPPLLPGGSAYEQGIPTRIPEIASYGGMGYEQGASYNVNISGSQEDIDRFNQAASGLNIGNYSTTMYNKIPDLSANPLMSFMDYL